MGMDTAARLRVLYLMGILLVTFDLLTCTHSQGAGDVWFSLNGTTYQNNSIVMLEEIGEGGDALLCITNLTACCQSDNTGRPALGNWFFPNGTRVLSGGNRWDFFRARGQMVVHLNRRRGGVEGIYRCEIPDAMNVTQTIYIGVYSASTVAILNGTTYQNNSIVTLEDIGEGGDALLCLTNQPSCCRTSNTGDVEKFMGNWYFPNGTRLPGDTIDSEEWDFFRARGQMVIRMNRRKGGVEGIYRCEIPDAMNVIQTKYIGVYSASAGYPSIASLTYNDQTRTLTCTSTGGPATTVTWRRDGVVITLNATHQQTKRIIDPVTGTYQTVLTIDPTLNQSSIVGTYSCTVENDRGNSSETVVVPAAVLNGTTYQNNSIVILKEIGEGDDALLCITNQTACCQPPYTEDMGSVLGNWFFPNGSRVPSDTVNDTSSEMLDFYKSGDRRVVRMNRRKGGVDGIYCCVVPDAVNVSSTILCIGVYTANTGSPSIGSLTYNNQTRTLTCTSTGGPATTVTWRRDGVVITLNATYQQTKRIIDPVNGTYQTVLTIDPSLDLRNIVGTYSCTVENVRGNSSETVVVPGGTTTVTPVSRNTRSTSITSSYEPTPPVSSNTRPTTTSPSSKVHTVPIIIVVAVVFIVLITVLGIVIFVVIIRAKKRKQQLKIGKENEFIKLKMKQDGTTEKTASSEECLNQNSTFAGDYNEIKAEKGASSEDHSNQSNTFVGEYSEIKMIPAGGKLAEGKYTPPGWPPRPGDMSNPMSGEMESKPMYQNIDKSHDPPSTTSVPQGTTSDDIYTMPDIISSQTVETDNETVYSEPIQPSLFTDVVGSHSEDLLPCAPIYTIPTPLPKSEKELLKLGVSNIREICVLGMGLFGKVILAETVCLSPKDLKMSESDEDKSKSTLVAVKKLKSNAPNATKEAFEKEVNFMSKLNDKNVIRILGVCYEDTPFIMMEYMEKGDLNQYLQKFRVLSTTDSEPQGQITTSTLVHITTQIASAMKYLASHNYVHRDLATRNCLVGPNYLVKISDFGMGRSLYESHYYRIHGRFALPVRWMSFECFYGKFSQKSDVWAFGVTTWEIFTLAKEQPYNDMSDKQVVDDAIKGKNRKLLAIPYMCPIKVYEIMLKCWEHNTKQRATFEELYQLLSSIHCDQQ